MFKSQNRYRDCSGFEAAQYVKECLDEIGCHLTQEQFQDLYDKFGNCGSLGNLDMDVQFSRWEYESVSGYNAMWRLTVPFFLLYSLIINFIVFPVHWIFTGKYSMGKNSKILAFSYGWYDRVFKKRDNND